MNLLAPATVLVCHYDANPWAVMDLSFSGRLRLCLANNVESALERIILEPGLILAMLDANWTHDEQVRLMKRIRSSRLAHVSSLPVLLVAEAAGPRIEQRLFDLDADAIVPSARGLHNLLRALATLLPEVKEPTEIRLGLEPTSRHDTDRATHEHWLHAASAVRDSARQLLRQEDRWLDPAGTNLSLQLFCEEHEVMIPLSRIARSLRHRLGETDLAYLSVHLENTTYRLPV